MLVWSADKLPPGCPPTCGTGIHHKEGKMPNGHKLDLRRFEKKVTDLSSALTHLGDGKDLRELILILHRPGWTTPAEFRFASAIVDSMATHVMALAAMKTELLAGAKLVEVAEFAER